MYLIYNFLYIFGKTLTHTMRPIPLLWGLIFFFCPTTYSQDLRYGDEWILPDQEYVRIGINKTGWYQLSSAELTRIGLPVQSILINSYQLFRRGQEIALRINTRDSSGTTLFESLEFYGKKNDGAPDSLLYLTPDQQPHTHYSLYSDTAAYFLTWSAPGIVGKRVENSPLSPGNAPPSTYLMTDTLVLFTSEYPAGNLYPMGATYDNGGAVSMYDTGEGWTGPKQQANEWNHYLLPTSRPVADSFHLAKIELLVVGRSTGEHNIEVWTGTQATPRRKLGQIQWSDYSTAVFTSSLLPADLSPNQALYLSIATLPGSQPVSISYLRLQYPQKFTLPLGSQQKDYLCAATTSLPFTHSDSIAYFDISFPSTPRHLLLSEAAVHDAGTIRCVLAVGRPFRVSSLQKVKFKTIRTDAVDYLIITHPSLRKRIDTVPDPVEEYARYRSTEEGGRFHPLILNSQEIADQFNYGEPGPLGIRRLIRKLATQRNLRFVFLVGQSRDPQSVRKLPNARDIDMVPNMGWPGSDIALTMGLDGTWDTTPPVAIGRLFASTPADVLHYLEKVKQHESQPSTAPWRKDVLHVSGGLSVNEINSFREYITGLKTQLDGSPAGASVRLLSKMTDRPVEHLPIAPILNKGLALLTIHGHSGLSSSDVDLGMVSDKTREYANTSLYPAVIVNGCAIGNYFYGPKTISTDWILTPSKGAILFLSHTHNGFNNSMKRYTRTFYEVLREAQFTSQPFGTILRETIGRYLQTSSSIFDFITAHQMNLQGDPAIRIFPAQHPDYLWKENSLLLTDKRGDLPTIRSDSIHLRAIVANTGRYNPGTYTILIRRSTRTYTTEHRIQRPTFPLFDTVAISMPNLNTNPGIEQWEFRIDPEQQLSEENKNNNTLLFDSQLYSDMPTPLLPANGSSLADAEVELVAELPPFSQNQQVVFEWSPNPDFSFSNKDTVESSGKIATKVIRIPADLYPHCYWRTAFIGDIFSPASTFRYNVDSLSPAYPEGIVMLSGPQVVAEGAPFSPLVSFQNISRQVFSDSLRIDYSIFNATETTHSFLTIPPLKEMQRFDYRPHIPTVGRTGTNRMVVHFNSAGLPETHYFNNKVETTFLVVADRIPPLLDVFINNRRLTNREAVSPTPTIRIHLMDENRYLLYEDTSSVEVWVQKICSTCPLTPVSLKDARWEVRQPNELSVTLPLNISKPGDYYVQVKGKDLSKNEAPPYRIQLRIADQNGIVSASASPNPVQDWVRFEMELDGKGEMGQWQISITDPTGRTMEVLRTDAHTGKNVLFWHPAQLRSGVYYYRMDLSYSKESAWPLSPKAEKGWQGKLILK